MSKDIKRSAEVMRATANILEILMPFDDDGRISIIMGAITFANIGEVLVGKARSMPDVSELLEKVKPKSDG
jgi:hypothetical protein